MKPLHLLRACLREASYLPDAVARQYFGRYIVRCFKAYQPRPKATTPPAAHHHHGRMRAKRRKASIIARRLCAQHKKAARGLRYLQRANRGEFGCLKRVLLLAYGRVGRRRHALLDALLQPDAPPNPRCPAPLQQLYHSDARVLAFFDPPAPEPGGFCSIAISDRFSRLRAVLVSQHLAGLRLRNHALKTPTHNLWMRPMPLRRARNNVRRWYADVLDKLLPPLPAREWDHVHAIIHREKKADLTRPRPRANVAVFAASAAAHAQPEPWRALVESLKLDKPSRLQRAAERERAAASAPRAVTPTLMRRLYHSLLHLCCKVHYDDTCQQWRVVWGSSKRVLSPRIYHAPLHPSLFDGVDTAGKRAKDRAGRISR